MRIYFQIVGSAVNFPDGNMDDIPALSQIAKKYNIGMYMAIHYIYRMYVDIDN